MFNLVYKPQFQQTFLRKHTTAFSFIFSKYIIIELAVYNDNMYNKR
jgi:hypothetical protein